MRRWLPGGLTAASGVGPRRVAVFAALAGVVAVSVITGVLVASGPEPERPPPLPVAHEKPTGGAPRQASSPAATDEHAEASSQPLVVSVVGKVANPGLVTLPPGSRVADAIHQAGGASQDADLLTVNLARRLSDGEQLYVGVPVPPGMPRPTAPGQEAAGQANPTEVDLNTADQRQLEALPGVGEVTAQRILDWRERNGPFTAVEQLREIDGIGEKRFADLREQVTVR
ncbi:DNA uptake protein [Saccharomonospora marina XMU15]|uniref:DNA uptake protein n=1 Tax=Saccharomonospora marina XMU15 TaxID=882083 RepID=H5X4F4_9PSEU|nr:ComEA family DNA-binding protein [Saccharomonospora marina]EHR49956.1 DNA uptake protein [Saccharomonospora marina XMU15]